MNLELDLLREQRDSIDDEVQRFEWALKQVRVALAGSAGMQWKWGGGGRAIGKVSGRWDGGGGDACRGGV